jgi:uncharacterized membrane protein
VSGAHHAIGAATLWRKSQHVLECRDGDLLTLLSLHTGRYHTLNALGAFIWERLDTPADVHQLGRLVHGEFEIGATEAMDDVAALLHELRALSLLRTAADGARAGSGGDATAPLTPAAGRHAAAPSTASIAFALSRVRLLLRLGGVVRAARFAYATPATVATSNTAALVDGVVERVNRIATLAPFRAECLERSLTVVRALRAAGIEAKLRLAIRHYPFEAHAWAEHAGVALNECGAVCALYAPFPALELEMLQCGR